MDGKRWFQIQVDTNPGGKNQVDKNKFWNKNPGGKNAHWFLKTVGGSSMQKGQLKAVGIIAELRKLALPVGDAEATPDAKAKPAEAKLNGPRSLAQSLLGRHRMSPTLQHM